MWQVLGAEPRCFSKFPTQMQLQEEAVCLLVFHALTFHRPFLASFVVLSISNNNYPSQLLICGALTQSLFVEEALIHIFDMLAH